MRWDLELWKVSEEEEEEEEEAVLLLPRPRETPLFFRFPTSRTKYYPPLIVSD